MATKMVKSTVSTEDPELASRFDRVLAQTVEALEEANIHYLFIGGIASGGLGRPRSTFDIDVFVRPEEAELTLRALAKKGFDTEKTDPVWLYKGYKENILVDIIFKSKGEIYLDSEMYQRITVAEFHGKKLRLVSPEDLVIIKAAAHSELTPGHWHDALAILSHAKIDWEYLLRRARKAPRRVLSLLIYAQASDIWVPNNVVSQLYRELFAETGQTEPRATAVTVPVTPVQPSNTSYAEVPTLKDGRQARVVYISSVHSREAYAAAHLREALAEDPRTHELDIEVLPGDGKILLRGDVINRERINIVLETARERCPSLAIESQLRVCEQGEPIESELLI